ncbi:phosphoglucomutase/phosphomannomutase alpha/beta/alpha domain I [Fibrisoma limi BUZ 3]|uniref:Phosphoglucomutase/phosphomannomutase alpha/beta/alpha domain I n=1 Tax=Fibrisoma limi BUZ 3 TaxID=1185876 RepID=I2GNM9_9BACT|nr:phospho-sugar mutase [Fibrisoma limi]CCH55507.1 phosphoglucomutase/phosphomannomutase alpha/beta/alpha domain I [Fibrisoma limi BUZ 3]
MTTAIDSSTQQRIDRWLNGNYDADTKSAIRQMMESDTAADLIDSFYRDLEFGTGGLRGVIGVGSNRMNRYTVGAATQGLANYLNATFKGEDISVAIAHDSRRMSPEFARLVSDIFSANNIKVYLFSSLRPTPELSFAIRQLGCQSGIVVTASHNPPEYNGYKVYWNDGGQVVAPHDKNIIEEVNKITSVDDIKFEGVPEKIHMIDEEIDAPYVERIKTNAVNPDVIARQSNLNIVYTPIHGTGITMVPRTLEALGFTNVHIVEEQATPDGNFPTVKSPNPEERAAMQLALELAQSLNADLVMATDPDSDRVGAGARNHHGEFELLNGNQMASLIIYYLLNAWKDAGKLTGKEFVAKTIVTTDLIDRMCERYGVTCYNTLTGFKYIASVIRELEGQEQFIGGGEESYGYLIGDFVRDKDAIASCAIIAELTAYAKDKGLSLFDMLMEMYQENGFYYEALVSLTKKGKSGAEEIQQMMADFRANPPKEIAGSPVIRIDDYKQLTRTDIGNEVTVPIEAGKMGIESSNVLQFFTADGTKVSARPSGTEPKIKFYVSVREPLTSKEAFDETYEQLKAKVQRVIDEMNLK